MSRVSFSTQARHLAVRVPQQHHLRAGETDRRNPAHQAIGGEHRQVHSQPVAAAEVNLHRAPPVGWVAEDHVGQLELPGRLALPAKKLPQPVVFAGSVFVPAWPGCATAGSPGAGSRSAAAVRAAGMTVSPASAASLLRRPGQAEQRQKQAANAQLQAGRRLARQIQNNQRQQHNQTQRNIMRPS